MTYADTGEFVEFYSTNFHRIATQLYAYLGDHAEAQDVTQEAFCRALDRWDKVSAYEDAVAWVRRVAWNRATSRLRHVQVARRYLARQRVEHVEAPSVDRVDLTRALATLPANQIQDSSLAPGRIAVFDPGSHAWRELPPMPEGRWSLTPDNKELWVVGAEKVWKLVDGVWQQRPGPPIHGQEARPLGNGDWVVLAHGGALVHVARNGTVTRLLEGVTGVVEVLRDGSLLVSKDGEYYLGHGVGAQREWARFDSSGIVFETGGSYIWSSGSVSTLIANSC